MDYSDKQFSTMQQEAIKRVREMQKRSRTAVNGINQEEDEQKEKEIPPEKEENVQTLQKENSVNPVSAPLFNLGGIKIDEEKALIGLLIYILYKQNADVKLLLALGYLLL